MGSIRKINRVKGTVYRAEVRLDASSKPSLSFRTKEEAKNWIRKMETEKDHNRSHGVTRIKITLDDYFDRWMEEYAKVHHSQGWQLTDRQMYRDYVQPILGKHELAAITNLDLHRVIRNMLDMKRSPSTVNRLRQLLHKAFQEALVTYRYIAFNPVSGVKKIKETPKPRTVLNEIEAFCLLEWADRQMHGISIHLALGCGLRECEVVALRWKDVFLEEGFLRICATYEKKTKLFKETTKSHKIRYIPLSSGLRDRLVALKEQSTSEYVLQLEDGSPVTPWLLIDLLAKGITEIKVTKVTFHELRHTFASLWTKMYPGKTYELKILMGHSSLSTTQNYIHLDADYVKQIGTLDFYSPSAQTPPTEERQKLKLVSD